MAELVPAGPVSRSQDGSIGLAVLDGSYEDTRNADQIVRAAGEYLSQSGLKSSPMPYEGIGSIAGEVLVSIGTALVTEVIIHSWAVARRSFRNWKERSLDQRLGRHQKECYVQLEDRRGEARDAVQMLLLIPGLRTYLSEAYPNRTYYFAIASAMPSVEAVQILLRNYEPFTRTVRRMAKILLRLPQSSFARFYLEPGPSGSMLIAYNVV